MNSSDKFNLLGYIVLVLTLLCCSAIASGILSEMTLLFSLSNYFVICFFMFHLTV